MIKVTMCISLDGEEDVTDKEVKDFIMDNLDSSGISISEIEVYREDD